MGWKKRACKSPTFHQTPKANSTLPAPVSIWRASKIAPASEWLSSRLSRTWVNLVLTNRMLESCWEKLWSGYPPRTTWRQQPECKAISSRTYSVLRLSRLICLHMVCLIPLSELDQHNCLLQGNRDYWGFRKWKDSHVRCHWKTWNAIGGLVRWSMRHWKIIRHCSIARYYVQNTLRKRSLGLNTWKFSRLQNDGIWAVYPQNRHPNPLKVRLLLDHLSQLNQN